MSPPLVIPFFIPHQGCPHLCIFCNQRLIAEQKSIGHAFDNEAERLSHVIHTYLKYKKKRSQVELAFFGGNFLGLKTSRILALLKAVQPWIRQDQIHSIRCSTRPDTVTAQTLDLARPFGLKTVEIGVQSMDDRVLALAQRGHTSEDTQKALALLKENGLKTGVQVMVGLPGDNDFGVVRTAEKLAELKPDLARIYPLLVLDGSKLAQWYRSGRYVPLSLDQAVGQTKKIVTIFKSSGVSVARIGLQATQMMDDAGQMISGPWHPAFGHLVLSALMFDQACKQIDTILKGQSALKGIGTQGEKATIVLQVNPRSLSRLQGDRKMNLDRLAQTYPGLSFSIERVDTLDKDQVHAQILST
ncbi:MAG: histone acetyltransferase [Desulfobacter postgatei]|uniref:Histone acetyltransferase n=1 Tax=Desulfobacter postgatei TaxID=2293 RepID=A0A2G6MPQ4_9BACT|nr:MAG: histone acetyltransferase [Desulfobacter postgatei]